MNCDEVIVCASGSLFMGVNKIENQKVGGKDPELLKKLQKTYEKQIIDVCGSIIA